MRQIFVSIFAVCATCAVSASPANSCTCVEFSDYRADYERAAYVVYGTVAAAADVGSVPYGSADAEHEPDTLRATKVALDVRVQWKGSKTDKLSFLSWCDVIFTHGSQYVVYTHFRDGQNWAILCGATRRVSSYWLFLLTHPLFW